MDSLRKLEAAPVDYNRPELPFSIRFDKENPLDRSLPLSPYEFNAICNCGKFNIPAHRHSHIEIAIIESNSAQHVINGKEYPAKENSLCLFMPFHVHELVNPRGSFVNLWFIDFDLGFILSHVRNAAMVQKVFDILYNCCPYMECPEKTYAEILRIMRFLVRSFDAHPNKAASPVDQYFIMKLINLILPLCRKETSPLNPWRVPQYINSYFKKNLSAKETASKLGLSVSSLNRFLVSEFGGTFSKILTDVRMSFSGSLLLAYPEINIVKIAQESGIDSEATFYRLFKKHYGMTPKEYRKMILKRFFNKTDDALPLLLNHELLLDIYRDHSRELTLRDFAQDNGLNPIQFKEDFVHCMGESFSRYVEDIRLMHAKNLLSMTTLTVDEIGRQVGYRQARSFTRAFSRKFDETPTEYRNKFKGLWAQSKNLPLK